MSVACNNCGAAVQLASSLNHQHIQLPNDPLIPFVKAQIDDLTAQNSNLVAENDSLSSKLVESTEGRMDLDQQLNMTQMELQAVQKELQTLKDSQKHYEQLLAMIATGQLIEKKDVQPVIENLAYESQRRSQIETSKMKLESELEDLSRSLFEEANRMVNEERQATYLAGKKVEGLERQLDEVLDLCKSERDQLVELKVSMGKLSEDKDALQRERDAFEFALVQMQQQQQQQMHNSSSATVRRGMPGGLNGLYIDAVAGPRKHVQQVLQYDARQHRSSASSIKSKTDSCYFSDGDHPGSAFLNDKNEDRIPTLGFHLWDPSFIEFKSYMEGLFGTANKPLNGTQHSATPSVASSGVTSMYAFNIMPKASTAAPPSASAVIPIHTLLSNCRLLKKISSEDVEATLRFEPGNLLSWTQRKRLVAAVTDNTLVVEAVPMSKDSQSPSPVVSAHPSVPSTPSTTTSSKPNCALCGNGINTPLSYQYRLTDTSNESRTICPYCRTRLTSVCTFYSVLRMISKRIISSTTTPEKLYLDFLRIRLGMFMARSGVGIDTGEESAQKRESTTRGPWARPLLPMAPSPTTAPATASTITTTHIVPTQSTLARTLTSEQVNAHKAEAACT